MAFSIDCDFPGGSIEVVRARAQGVVELALREDSASDIRQWFDFVVQSDSPKPRTLSIVNASESSFPSGWPGYQAIVCRNGRSWSRAKTSYDGKVLTIQHEPLGERTRYSYFMPYPLTRLERLLRKAERGPWADVSIIGESCDGLPIHLASFGDEEAPRTIWIVARQHPGETPASWAMEGLIERLGEAGDEALGALLAEARVRVVPLVNPDGVMRGNHRTSASGSNLNRVWDDPSAQDAPEVVAIREAIEATGVDLFFDVHADEASSFAFAACSEGNPSYGEEIAFAEAQLRSDLAELTPEFIDEPVYDLDEPGEADLSCASNFIGEAFGCPSITLELPIKGDGGGRIVSGWSHLRAQRFGRSLVDVLLRAVNR